MTKWLAICVMCYSAMMQVKAQYTFVGSSSSLGNNCYQITPNIAWQNGAIWYNEQINLEEPFHLQYEASFGNNPNGADGMVFVMQQVGNNVLGEDGGGIGFSGFSPSFGVEFDTWQNLDFGDPGFDHIAFLRNGSVNHNTANNLAGPVQASSTNVTISDGLDHVVDIFWEPGTNTFSVWFDCVPRLSAQINLIQTIFNNNPVVFWGFTSATGGSTNQHKVCLDPFILGLPENYQMCLGDEIQLEASGTSGGTYSWEPAALVSDPTISNPTVSPEVNTNFTVTFTDLCGTEQSQSTLVEVFEATVQLPATGEACTGESFTITPIISSGSLLWSDGSTGPTLVVTESGTYTLTISDGPCTVADDITVTFSDNPELDLVESASICQGESFTVDLSGSGFAISWADNPAAGAVRELTDAGTYTAIGSVGTCTGEASITLTAIPLPVFNLGPDVDACEGEEVTLTANVAGAEVSWNTGQSTPSITVSETGVYEASALSEGCSYIDAVEVLLLSRPVASISGTTSFCANQSTTLTASGGDTYLWSTGATEASLTHAQIGKISVTATDASTGCTGSAQVTLTNLPLPDVRLPEGAVKCAGRTLLLTPELSGVNTVDWNTEVRSPTLQVLEPGEYTATAENNCGQAFATIIVTDEDCFQSLYIPNAFTPNGDGINDLFRVQGEGIERFEMQIFDRMGKLVFETNNIHDAWNGSVHNGSYYCQSGLYSVRVALEYDDKTLLEQVRHLTLLR